MATELFMVEPYEKGKELTILDSKARAILTSKVKSNKYDDQIRYLAKKYGDVNFNDFALKLVNFAVRYEFHFDLLLEMIPYYHSPSKALKKILPHYFQLLKTEARGYNNMSFFPMMII